MEAIRWRWALLIVLAALCQGILAVHDAQHIDGQPSTCTVCHGHAPQMAAAPPGVLLAPPLTPVIARAPLRIRAAGTTPYTAFQSRAPPAGLS
jgi:hypothetical protein